MRFYSKNGKSLKCCKGEIHAFKLRMDRVTDSFQKIDYASENKIKAAVRRHTDTVQNWEPLKLFFVNHKVMSFNLYKTTSSGFLSFLL